MIYISKVNRKYRNKGVEKSIFYKPKGYRGYIRFNANNCMNIFHHQELPDNAIEVPKDVLSTSVINTIKFLDMTCTYD